MKHLFKSILPLIIIGLVLVFGVSCGKDAPLIPVDGIWRAVLYSPGGELPFQLEIRDGTHNVLIAGVRNGEEYLPFSSVERIRTQLILTFEHYDSKIVAEVSSDGLQMTGTWSKRALGGKSTEMKFSAEKDILYRFPPSGIAPVSPSLPYIDGEWAVNFTDSDGEVTAKGIFNAKGTFVTGTFLTPTGDYRYLEGTFENKLLLLSVFDGAHAFLFRAELEENGALIGDFWSRNSYHARWIAVRSRMDMPDPFSLTRLTNDTKRFDFRFPDMDKNMVSSRDPQFEGKVLIVYVFGTWCPNCNDEAAFLEELYMEYNDRGLEIVGLANEFTGEFVKDREMVLRYRRKYGISWPMLLVGIADKKETARKLADLDRVPAYPTTIFIDRDKKVRKIYTGFSGPGTGRHHLTLRSQFKKIIEDLLNNNPPETEVTVTKPAAQTAPPAK